MSDISIAQRYAKPLVELGIEKGILDKIYEDMLLFAETCEQNSQFRAVLQNPVIRGYKKLSILKQLFAGKLNDLTFSLFEILAKRNREAVLYTISKEFINMYHEYKGILFVTVTTTISLSDILKNELKNSLATSLNKTIVLKEEVRADLIGGFILKIGNSQIDNSIKNSLQRLKLNFIEKLYS